MPPFRFRLPSKRLVAVATAPALLVHERKDKYPIYPKPDEEILLQEVPSELEQHIGSARRAVTASYLDVQSRVQGVVSRWIGVEQKVEKRVKSLIAPEEPLTPGLLYVGVATLTGSVIARNRIIFTRLLLPPTLFILSLNHFLPKTSHNISSYLGQLEDTYFPTLAEKHAIANAHTAMTWERAKEATANGRETLGHGVEKILGRVQESTGLKLKEALGIGEKASIAIKEKAQEVAEVVETKAVEAEKAVEAKVEEVKVAAEKKVEEIKRLV
ncbi:apolipo protein O-domain-containing protein [Irpex rosettiformis]|uniref:Apolipo protein O-domain-containing protein n=1 Tax=Irpex rosettiformis TaxID=378272 RepID=A0ACB8TRY6_9APHY|nr:apolipo protein O-domain-containing protein [Irpex rosettiformis]